MKISYLGNPKMFMPDRQNVAGSRRQMHARSHFCFSHGTPLLCLMACNRASLLDQPHRRNLRLCRPQGDSHIEQNQSTPCAPIIPGNRFSGPVPIVDNENNCDALDLTNGNRTLVSKRLSPNSSRRKTSFSLT